MIKCGALWDLLFSINNNTFGLFIIILLLNLSMSIYNAEPYKLNKTVFSVILGRLQVHWLPLKSGLMIENLKQN